MSNHPTREAILAAYQILTQATDDEKDQSVNDAIRVALNALSLATSLTRK